MRAQAKGDSAIGAAAERLGAAAYIVEKLALSDMGGDFQAKVADLRVAIQEALGCVTAAEVNQKALIKKAAWFKERLSAVQDWESERSTYEMRRFDPGVFAYSRKLDSLRPDQRLSSDAAHLLCPNCFDNRRKSILQSTPKVERRYQVHMCPECKNEYAFYYEVNGMGG